MKRILKLLTGALLGLLLLMPYSRALALQAVAQRPSDFTNGCLYAGNSFTFSEGTVPAGGQIFVANKNRVTGITVYMKYAAINSIQLHLIKASTMKAIEISPIFAATNEDHYVPGETYSHKWTLNQGLTPGEEYLILLIVKSGTAQWGYFSEENCDPTGRSGVSTLSPETTDMTYMVQGYNYVAPAPSTGTKTGTVKTTAPATTVAPSVLAVPKNFHLDRDLEAEKIFAWDKNTEATLTGYMMYVMDGETLTETIDIPDKELDNYNLVLADHPLLVKNKEYTVKLAAKTATAVSEKSEGVKTTFADAPKVTVAVAEAEMPLLSNPYVLGGLGLLLLVLLALLIFLERKYHGLANLFQKKSEK